MRGRKRIALPAALICLSAISFFACGGADPKAATKGQEAIPSAGAASPGGSAAVSGHKLTVYYFHSKRRCPTCMKMEAYTREAVTKGFANLVKTGRVELKVVDVDEPRDRHFVEDFKLITKSVVIVDSLDGKQVRWKNLDKIWKLVVNRFAFVKYVQDEINAYLRESLERRKP
jgi:hypothetical protein